MFHLKSSLAPIFRDKYNKQKKIVLRSGTNLQFLPFYAPVHTDLPILTRNKRQMSFPKQNVLGC